MAILTMQKFTEMYRLLVWLNFGVWCFYSKVYKFYFKKNSWGLKAQNSKKRDFKSLFITAAHKLHSSMHVRYAMILHTKKEVVEIDTVPQHLNFWFYT